MLLELLGAERRYGGRGGIADVTIRIPAGSVYVLCGQNGAGKTTTLSVLCGALFTTRGSMTLAGVPIRTDRYAPRPGLGYVADSPWIDPDLTPLQWLGFVSGIKARRITSDPEALAEDLTLAPTDLDAPINSLSYGTRRKVSLWAEFLTTSSVLIMDEPLIGLDPLAIEGFRRVAQAFVHSGRAIVLSTHLLREAQALATHVGVIHAGRTVREGTTVDVRDGLPLHAAFVHLVSVAG